MQANSPPTAPAWRRRPSGYVFPLLLVIVGAVLLLNNFGILPWSVWTALGQLWPVILILLGIDLLVGRRNAVLGAAITAITLVAVLGAAVWLTFAGASATPQSSQTEQHSVDVPLAGATSATISLRYGAGILNVGSLPDGGTYLARATASLPPGMRLGQQVHPSGDTADVTLSAEGSNSFHWPFHGFGRAPGDMTMNVQLAPKIPLTLRADVGAGQSDFDLTNLSVQSFALNNGAGQATVRFPTAPGRMTANIHSGAGQLILEIPPGVAASIHGNNGLVNLQVPTDRFQKVADGYRSSDYATATNQVDITLNVGFGEVDVR